MNEKIFSYGGGVQSNAALVLAANGLIDYKTFVFANVGAKAENPETIQYVQNVAIPYAEHHGIEIITLDKKDKKGNKVDLFEHILRPLRSIDIPVKMPGSGRRGDRNCTAQFKTKVIEKHCWT